MQDQGLQVQDENPRYFDGVRKGKIFWAANQAAQAVSAALATTYTGLCLSNPAGSGKNLVLMKVGIALSVAPAAIAPVGLITGFSAAGVVTHTTALTPASSIIGGASPSPVAKADSAATIVGTPAWTQMLMGGFTAGALPSEGPALIDIEGGLLIQPGGYVAIGALTAITGLFSMLWSENDSPP